MEHLTEFFENFDLNKTIKINERFPLELHWSDYPALTKQLKSEMKSGKYSHQLNSLNAELEKLKYEEEVKLRSDELESMIGLQSVKEEIKRLNAMLTYNQSRLAEGLDEISQGSYHMVFTGNPGTGKTVVARLVAKMLTDKGILKNDKVIEVTRSDLVGKYVGHTAPQVRSIVDEAMGGVLFIDEAYTLSSGGEKDFGQEAIDELLKLMEVLLARILMMR